jgi:hypothetical protein
MKRFASLLTAVVIALAGMSTLSAGEKAAAGSSTVKGWIVDEYCGAKNANAAGTQCAKDCIKKGAKAVLAADGKTYNLSNQKLATTLAGQEVEVTGTIDKDGMISVEKIVPVETKSQG